jgi:hypothetical protein
MEFFAIMVSNELAFGVAVQPFHFIGQQVVLIVRSLSQNYG